MKSRNLILFSFLATFFILSGLIANAQCDSRGFQRQAKQKLNPYQLEALITRPLADFEHNQSTIEAEFVAYKNETYQFCNLSNGFKNTMYYEILGPDKQMVFSSKENGDESCKFVADWDGNYTIVFYLPKEKEKIIEDACVAFAIGFGL